MPTAPTRVSYTETASWHTSGSPKSIASISWQIGDVLVAVAGAEGRGTETVGGISNTGSGLSWGAAKQTHSASSDCAACVFACVATADSSGVISMTNNNASSIWGFGVWVYRGSDGIGNSTEQDTTVKTVPLTPTAANSAIVWGVMDWSAEAAHTLTPTPTNTDEASASSGYTAHAGDLTDQTSAGSTSYGITGGGSTGPYTIVVLEIKGAASAAAPFVMQTSPNPIRMLAPHVGYTDASEFWMLVDTQFREPGQPTTYDWPNPRGYPFPIENRGFIESPNLGLMGKDLFFGAAGEPPTYEPAPPPLGYLYPPILRSFIHETNLALIGKDQFYGAAGQPPTYEPPPNPLGYHHPEILRTFTQSTPLNLIGLDQFFGAPGQPPVSAMPNPTWLARSIQPIEFINLLNTTLAVVLTTPFRLLDWPNPRVRLYAATPTDPPNLLNTTLVVVVAGTPFSMLDWPNPRVSTRTPQADSPPVPLTLLGGGAIPFRLTEWPNPTKYARVDYLHAWIQSLLETTLGVVPPPPFAQFDWPNPVRLVRAPALYSFLQGVNLELLGQDQFFGAAGQPPTFEPPPNPRGYPHPISNLTLSVSTLLLPTPTPPLATVRLIFVGRHILLKIREDYYEILE